MHPFQKEVTSTNNESDAKLATGTSTSDSKHTLTTWRNWHKKEESHAPSTTDITRLPPDTQALYKPSASDETALTHLQKLAGRPSSLSQPVEQVLDDAANRSSPTSSHFRQIVSSWTASLKRAFSENTALQDWFTRQDNRERPSTQPSISNTPSTARSSEILPNSSPLPRQDSQASHQTDSTAPTPNQEGVPIPKGRANHPSGSSMSPSATNESPQIPRFYSESPQQVSFAGRSEVGIPSSPRGNKPNKRSSQSMDSRRSSGSLSKHDVLIDEELRGKIDRPTRLTSIREALDPENISKISQFAENVDSNIKSLKTNADKMSKSITYADKENFEAIKQLSNNRGIKVQELKGIEQGDLTIGSEYVRSFESMVNRMQRSLDDYKTSEQFTQAAEGFSNSRAYRTKETDKDKRAEEYLIWHIAAIEYLHTERYKQFQKRVPVKIEGSDKVDWNPVSTPRSEFTFRLTASTRTSGEVP